MRVPAMIRSWGFLALFSVGTAVPVLGQVQPAAPEVRGRRVLGVGHVGFPHAWEPSVTVGFLGQLSLRRMSPTLVDGVRTYSAPLWYAHAMATAGIRTEGGPALTAHGEFGIVRRMGLPGFFTSVGMAGFYEISPEGYGAVVRSDLLMDNAFLQAGIIRLRKTDGTGLYLGFGLMRCLLRDLEFVDLCIGG